MEDKKITIPADSRPGDEEKEKVRLKTHDADTMKYIERKLVDKGVGRLDRRPVDGLPRRHDPKKGHGGKYTWEGPESKELEAEPAVDEGDPNYVVDEEYTDVSGLVVGEVEVEVAKAAAEGVARLEVDPHLKFN